MVSSALHLILILFYTYFENSKAGGWSIEPAHHEELFM